jgi:hypothetical protein
MFQKGLELFQCFCWHREETSDWSDKAKKEGNVSGSTHRKENTFGTSNRTRESRSPCPDVLRLTLTIIQSFPRCFYPFLARNDRLYNYQTLEEMVKRRDWLSSGLPEVRTGPSCRKAIPHLRPPKGISESKGVPARSRRSCARKLSALNRWVLSQCILFNTFGFPAFQQR